MDAILTDSHLDTRIKTICALMNVIVPKSMQEKYGKGTRNSQNNWKQQTVQMAAAESILLIGCSKVRSSIRISKDVQCGMWYVVGGMPRGSWRVVFTLSLSSHWPRALWMSADRNNSLV